MANVGIIDRALRVLIGVVLLWVAFGSGGSAMDSTAIKYGTTIVGAILIGTAFFKFCPLYRLLGIRTCKAC